ncbi:MAG: hypothetical protein ABW072_02205 [Sedimenticola sp.]
MYVSDKLIYLELHKTGCSHIRRLLETIIPGQIVGKHNRWTDGDTHCSFIGSIRNPWSWYVSLWAFGCQQKGALYNTLTRNRLKLGFHTGQMIGELKNSSGFPIHTFKAFSSSLSKNTERWKAVYQDQNNAEQFRAWLKMLYDPSRLYESGASYSSSSIANLAGIMTYRYLWLHCKDISPLRKPHALTCYHDIYEFDNTENLLDAVIKQESLEPDLIQALRQVGYSLSNREIEMIMQGEKNKTNKSKHHPTSYYYDTETIDLIADKDRLIIEKYGYKAPSLIPNL